MFAVIDNKVYEMDMKTFEDTRKIVETSKNGKYSIYCLLSHGKAFFINEEYKTKHALTKNIAKYSQKGFHVFFTTESK